MFYFIVTNDKISIICVLGKINNFLYHTTPPCHNFCLHYYMKDILSIIIFPSTSRGGNLPFNFSTIHLTDPESLGVMEPQSPQSTPLLSGGVRESSLGPGTELHTLSLSGMALETTLGGLRPHTSYKLVLRAFNSIGPGPSSDAVTAKTLEDSKYYNRNSVCCFISSNLMLEMKICACLVRS